MLTSRSSHVSTDLCLLEQILQLCGVFGTLPFCFRRTTWKIWCYYAIYIAIQTFGISRFCILVDDYFNNLNLSGVEFFLVVLDFIPKICFLMVCIFIVFTKKVALEELLKNFKLIDSDLFPNFRPEGTPIVVIICYCQLIPIISLIDKMVSNNFSSNHIDVTLSVIYLFLVIYMKFLYMITIKILEKILEARYTALENEIKNYFCSLRVRIGNRKFRELSTLSKLFFKIHQTIEGIDDIFGWPIMILIMKGWSGLLISFNYILISQKSVTLAGYWNMIELSFESVVSFKN